MDSAKNQIDPWDYVSITTSDVDNSNTIDLSGLTTSLSSGSYTIGAVGSNMSGGYTFDNSTITSGWDYSPAMAVNQSGQISLSGDNADIVINGVSLVDKLDAIAERLNILDVNPELEAEWDQLKELGEQYRQLEQDLKAKSEMWKTLKTKTSSKPRS